MVNDLLAAYDIPVAETTLTSPSRRHWRQLVNSDPGRLKIASPDIQHKSEFGGVVLDVRDEISLEKGFKELVSRIKLMRPDAHVLGVHVQPMVLSGQEVILGAVKDPQFGQLVMFGSGGVEVEGLKVVSFGMAPIFEDEAGTFSARPGLARLEWFRNRNPLTARQPSKHFATWRSWQQIFPSWKKSKSIPCASSNRERELWLLMPGLV
jgi:acetyltransferase